MRNGAMQRSNARGAIERIASSKSRVKSKPPLQCSPAHGPKLLSKGQDAVEFSAIDGTENQLPIRKAAQGIR